MLDVRLQLDVIACSAAMSACERGLQWGRALSMLSAASAAGLEPDDAAVGVAARGVLAAEAEPHEVQRWRCSLELIARSHTDDLPTSTALCSNAISACAKGKHWVLAVDILHGMRRSRVVPSTQFYNAAASACGTVQEGQVVERLQREMQESAVEPSAITLTAAMGALDGSQWHRSSLLLEELSTRGMESDVISNTAAINLFGKGQQWAGALDLFAQANLQEQALNAVSYGTMISACSQGHQLERALYLIKEMDSRGLELHIMVAFGAAMVALGRCRKWQQALRLLRSFQRSGAVLTVPAYSSSIGAFAECQQWWRALDLLREMSNLELQPDAIALSSAFSAAKKGGQWERALELLRRAVASGTELNAVAYNAAASALESGQQWEAALSLLQEMEGRSIAPDHVTYGTLISACEKGQCWELALGLLQEMRTVQLLPDVFACSAAISACGVCGRWEAALDLLRDMSQAAVETQVSTCNAAISACERGGRWQRALQLLRAMPALGLSQDVIGFNAAMLACLSCQQWASALQLFGEMGERGIQPDMQGYRLLLTESELRGQPEREAALLTEVRDALFPGRASPVRVRLLEGLGPEEREELSVGTPSRSTGPASQPSRPASDPRRWLAPQSRGPRLPRGLAHGPASARAAPGTPYAKELGLLEHVLTTASRGDPSSVCAAVERYGDQVLRGASWLKVAGGPKAAALAAAARAAPAEPAAVLEIGAYCGYSALQLAIAVPGVRVVSLEVDAAHMLIARNVIAFAGLGGDLDVLTGHSRDLLPRLAHRYRGPGSSAAFSAVFMDQRGSLYHRDLAALEAHGLLRLPGAVVVADNVLKPGAPLFLRRTSADSGKYESQVVTVREFAMRGVVEDWMSVVVALRSAGLPAGGGSDDREEEDPEPEFLQLDREADRMRERAIAPGKGVDFGEWAAFVEDARLRLEELGIWETAESAEL